MKTLSLQVVFIRENMRLSPAWVVCSLCEKVYYLYYVFQPTLHKLM